METTTKRSRKGPAYGIKTSHTLQAGPLECGHRLVETGFNLYPARTYPCRGCGYELRTLLSVDTDTTTNK